MRPEAQKALRRIWLKQELARYQQQSEAHPERVEVWRQLGRIHWELGEAEETVAALERALALQPEDGEAGWGLTVAYLALKRYEEALTAATRLLNQFPQHADAWVHRVEALLRLERFTEGLAVCEEALALPLSAVHRVTLIQQRATFLSLLNRREEALAAVLQGLALAPHNPELWISHAWLLYRLRRFTEALAATEQALALSRTPLAAQCMKARVLAALWRFEEADALLNELQAHYSHAQLEREFEPWRLPDETATDSLMKRYTGRGLYMAQVFEEQQECDWTDWEKTLAHLEDLTADALRYGFVAGLEPHRLLSVPLKPMQQQAVARAQARAIEQFMAPVRERLALRWASWSAAWRIRVGYVSADFRNHATAHLIRRLFQVHDRERFEIFGYSLRPGDGSTYWEDIRRGCDQFVELCGVSNAEAAARIAADGIQILVDLNGYTRFARPEIFALRPAPVQVAFLGYPGTLGADYIPYVIADPVVLPEELRFAFSEQPIYLECYQVNDDQQPIAETGLTRQAVGLPETGFVYCCFNNPYKIEPVIFRIWMRILQQVPGSVLWLLAHSSRCTDHLRAAAERHGVAGERLIFAPFWPKARHLERHRLADVFLDTLIVNAHTGASDALWAGLPVLTCPGANFQSRVCASLLSALGLSDWIAQNVEDYERRAVALAHRPTWVQAGRERLAQKRLAGALFATERFARQLERAFETLWGRFSNSHGDRFVKLPGAKRD